jgi:hypothetical protein
MTNDNDRRITIAAAALGLNPDAGLQSVEENITDLLANLHHYADSVGAGWQTCVDRAELHHEEETAEAEPVTGAGGYENLPDLRPDYAEACRRAATAQGLDPIAAALTAAGIPVEIDQTGGFTMCARIQHPDGRYLYVTEEEHDPPAYMVGEYPALDALDPCQGSEGVTVTEDADALHVVDIARTFLAR